MARFQSSVNFFLFSIFLLATKQGVAVCCTRYWYCFIRTTGSSFCSSKKSPLFSLPTLESIEIVAMKFSAVVAIAFVAAPTISAFAPMPFGATRVSSTSLNAEIRPPSEKSKELRFGWDGSTALGGAVENAAPARMLDEIRAAGETIPPDCEVFNANVEMEADSLKMEDVLEIIDTHYETGLIEWKNGDLLNQQGENEGSAKILSYAALSEMDKETTLKLWGQYYREVLKDADGDSHQNIRNFMKTGWDGVPFENGIALTRKNAGDNEWDAFAESWIP